MGIEIRATKVYFQPGRDGNSAMTSLHEELPGTEAYLHDMSPANLPPRMPSSTF